MSVLGKPVVRAAVYTRKSSDEGLDQEFNSLDAQHEACSVCGNLRIDKEEHPSPDY